MSSDEAPELSGSAELTEPTATTGASCELNGIKYNNKNHEDWGEALVSLRLFIDKHTNELINAEELQQPECKRDRVAMPNSKARTVVWSKFGEEFPELRNVAVRLLSAHTTSAASERSWKSSSLGMQHAKALIAICSAANAKIPPTVAFQITLDVLDGDV
jgi:hypothetical protein